MYRITYKLDPSLAAIYPRANPSTNFLLTREKARAFSKCEQTCDYRTLGRFPENPTTRGLLPERGLCLRCKNCDGGQRLRNQRRRWCSFVGVGRGGYEIQSYTTCARRCGVRCRCRTADHGVRTRSCFAQSSRQERSEDLEHRFH